MDVLIVIMIYQYVDTVHPRTKTGGNVIANLQSVDDPLSLLNVKTHSSGQQESYRCGSRFFAIKLGVFWELFRLGRFGKRNKAEWLSKVCRKSFTLDNLKFSSKTSQIRLKIRPSMASNQ